MRGVDAPIDIAALDAFGLELPAALEQPPAQAEIWPENVAAVLVFCALTTSWSYSAASGKPTGLRYEALPVVMRYSEVPKADRPEVFAGLRIMEAAVLEMHHE